MRSQYSSSPLGQHKWCAVPHLSLTGDVVTVVARPTLPIHVDGTCPESNWTTYGDTCFLFRPDTWLTADEAAADCLEFGGRLATIRNFYENLFVQTQLSLASILPYSRKHWIGLERAAGGNPHSDIYLHPVFFEGCHFFTSYGKLAWILISVRSASISLYCCH